jgi:hypothetical protein
VRFPAAPPRKPETFMSRAFLIGSQDSRKGESEASNRGAIARRNRKACFEDSDEDILRVFPAAPP